MTIPLDGVPLHAMRELLPHIRSAGFDELWSSEVAGLDGTTPLTLAAAWDADVRLGTAVLPVFTRGPGLLAMTAAAMAEVAPGRFTLGVGASSPAVVQQWNGIAFEQPFARTREVLRFVRAALAGEKVDSEALGVTGFRLERPPAAPPRIALAALRPGMLRLAGREADGVLLNWLAATDVERCVAEVAAGHAEHSDDTTTPAVTARVFVCPTEDADHARNVGRRMIAAYLTVPAYAAFHEWLGRGPRLAAMAERWHAGDRRGALAAIDDDVVDELIVHGSPAACREHLQRYADAGVGTPVVALVPSPDVRDAGSLLTTLSGIGGAA
ncbi:LLM class F420-dependent oxidoreductase [Jatrophihabitans sp. YIM 134969]